MLFIFGVTKRSKHSLVLASRENNNRTMASVKKKTEALIDQFCAVTGADRSVGSQLLEACNGNLELAIDMQMEGAASTPSSSGAGPSSSNATDSSIDAVRAPIPQTQEVLVDEVSTFGFRGRRRKVRSVFDGFRDFQAEARDQEERMTRGSSSTQKQRTLEDLFRPPIDMTYKGTFCNAREAGTSQGKWLMVNIQNVQEFACQALNRDLWSNSAVKALVKEHFIFWQVYQDSEEGKKYKQFYKVSDWPYIAVLDPQTGENLIVWGSITPSTFCEVVNEFLAQQPRMESVASNTSIQRADSIVDATEDMQMEAAIQASLTEISKPPNTDQVTLSDSDSGSDFDLETFTDSDDDSVNPSPVKVRKTELQKSPAPSPKKTFPSVKKTKCADAPVPQQESSRTHSSRDSRKSPAESVQVSKQVDTVKQTSSVKNSEKGSEQKKNVSEVQGKTSKEKDKTPTDSNFSQDYTAYLGKQEDPKTTLMLRFPNGQRDQLSIPFSSQLMAVVLYVGSKGFCNERFELVAHFPRRHLSHLDFHATLSEIGLHSQETIFVQAR